ncbi:Hypothetical predicted protein, partial [Paramuricea clavata]
MAASEALPYAKSVFNGLYDSIFGIITFFKPIYQKQDNIHNVTAQETEEINTNRTRRRLRPTTTTQKTQ